jgi:enamine deaminase RidA (YjgF/YER057c/UK114 family)
MKRLNISSGSAYEKPIGFSRAVRIGSVISVSGTAPIAEDGNTYCPGDLYLQTIRCIEIIQNAVIKAGGKLENVIRTRVYLKNISEWEKAAKAHGEFFGDIRPACTFVEIKGLIKDDWLVEMEADCIVE